MKGNFKTLISLIIIIGTFYFYTADADATLRVSSNPRYFMDASGRIVYLTGTQTWPNLIDRGPTDPPRAFDFTQYLDFLEDNNHNFTRLWSRHLTKYLEYGNTTLYSGPLAWPRTGPGSAFDGKPKFDLNQFNQAYFDRLRSRVIEAQNRGIYVSIMLFGGKYEAMDWQGHPFNINNNINGVNGDTNGDGQGYESQTWPLSPSVDAVEKAYIRKVIDTVNDLDNVLYEISNEGPASSAEWQHQLISYIKSYEASKPKQHPVGMTSFYDPPSEPDGPNSELFRSAADWVSPGATGAANDPYVLGPPAATGNKVIILDWDHVWPPANNEKEARSWIWKSFVQGHNPIFMEEILINSVDGLRPGDVGIDDNKPIHIAVRAAMGDTRTYADKINLATAQPHGSLSSTGYALANPGLEYIVYQPNSGSFTVNMNAGNYTYEWFNPASGSVAGTGAITASAGNTTFTPPFSGDAVLYLKSVAVTPPRRLRRQR